MDGLREGETDMKIRLAALGALVVAGIVRDAVDCLG